MSEKRKRPPLFERKNNSIRLICIILYCMVLMGFALLGIMMPLRPEESDSEKRTLTAFPELTAQSLLSGDFFSQVSLWYSDTYPFREELMDVQSSVKSLYGLKSETIIGPVEKADEIPTAPYTMPTYVFDITTAPGPQPAISTESELSSADPYILPESTAVPVIPSSEDPANWPSSEQIVPSSEQAVPSPEQPTPPPETAPPETAPPATEPEPTAPPETDPPVTPSAQVTPGEIQKIGSLYISGNAAYHPYYFSLKASNGYIETINKAAALLGDRTHIYSILVPTSASIVLSTEQQQILGSSSARDALAYVYSSYDSRVTGINTYDILMAHRSEYLYFRTDHHWTALGAYYAYTVWCNACGVAALPLTSYTQAVYSGFLGSFYSSSGKSPILANAPDDIYAYIPPDTNEMQYLDHEGNWKNWKVIYPVDKWGAGNKYSCFSAGDEPLEIIDNPNNSSGINCVVVKDSFGNPFIPFLIHHYDKVYVIDPRYYTISLSNFVNENGIKDVFFVNGMEFLNQNYAEIINKCLY
ncbi:MAG: hypothetical protein IKO30_08520 [Lachnospiraceae bacterium]|nr:hypothetical protein [Lachnospiraceae bacterium]